MSDDEMNGKKDAALGNWDEDFNNNYNADNRPVYMQFPEKGDYRVRFVGQPVSFSKFGDPFDFKDRVIVDPAVKDEVPATKAGFYPRSYYAIHLIDRRDGALKILEKSKMFFNPIASFKKTNNIDPGGINEGHDFTISVDWPGKNKRQTKYSIQPCLSPSPLTEEEKKMAKEKHWNLKKLYASTPLAKIKELWDALPEEAKIPKSKEESESPRAPANESVNESVNEPANEGFGEDNDDLFGESDASEDTSTQF